MYLFYNYADWTFGPGLSGHLCSQLVLLRYLHLIIRAGWSRMASVGMAYSTALTLPCFFIIQQASSGLFTWRLGRVPEERVEVRRPLELRLATVTSTVFCYQSKSQCQTRYKGSESSSPLDSRSCRVRLQRGMNKDKGRRKVIMAIFFSGNLPPPQFISLLLFFHVIFYHYMKDIKE